MMVDIDIESVEWRKEKSRMCLCCFIFLLFFFSNNTKWLSLHYVHPIQCSHLSIVSKSFEFLLLLCKSARLSNSFFFLIDSVVCALAVVAYILFNSAPGLPATPSFVYLVRALPFQLHLHLFYSCVLIWLGKSVLLILTLKSFSFESIKKVIILFRCTLYTFLLSHWLSGFLKIVLWVVWSVVWLLFSIKWKTRARK